VTVVGLFFKVGYKGKMFARARFNSTSLALHTRENRKLFGGTPNKEVVIGFSV
jgi:hypothetical protein